MLMVKLEDLGEVVSTDLLIIGGGIGGLVAAIKAKEESPNVNALIVEKQTVGHAGKAPKTGGIVSFLGPNDEADKFMEYLVRKPWLGAYLNDQELLEKYLRESYSSLEKLQEWGVTFRTDSNGKILVLKSPMVPPDVPWSTAEVSLDMMLPLRARARKMGVKMLNKIQVVKLLTKDGKVVGAVGFNIIDGKFYIFKAKASILATGDCGYKVKRFWRAASGDGLAMAYWAGAEMRNAEFGNMYGHIVARDTDAGIYPIQVVVNALGESLLSKYITEPGPWASPLHPIFLLGWEKEIKEGRGPIYADFTIPVKEVLTVRIVPTLPKNIEFHSRQDEKIKKYWPLASQKKVEVSVNLHGVLACVRVDHEMKTTLQGLWAIGNASWSGCGMLGAQTPPGPTQGCGLGFAYVSAMWGGMYAARFAASAPEPEVEPEQVAQFKEEIYAPIRRKEGLPPDEVIRSVQDVVIPVKYNLRRHGDRLKEALSKVEDVKRRLAELCANDLHNLMKCHEAKAMVTCAEMTFRAALMRTESRGWHYREDYPETDNKNWLKWIIVKKVNEEMTLFTEPVPIGRYKIKP
jgi:succinate dehydrogenase/fumarate reductase flavoprotein subunit